MPKKGERYRHYKGNVYEVIDIVRHSETMEDLVLYRNVGEPEKLWVRPIGMWDEIVHGMDGGLTKRFTKTEEP